MGRLDHVIGFNEASLYRHVKSFLAYYHESRTHLAGQDTPEPRPVDPPDWELSSRYRKWAVITTVRTARSLNVAVFPNSSPTESRANSRCLTRHNPFDG
jgi:hypothetical protein